MGLSHSPRIVTDGLVLALDAGNTKSYPGSGTSWTDTVGGNTATLESGLTYSSDDGGSIVFDGSNEYIQVPTNSNLTFTGDFTYETWVKTDVQTGSKHLWKIGDQSLQFTNNVSPDQIIYYSSGTGSQAYGVIDNDKWAHIVLTKSGNTLSGYLNGVQSWTNTPGSSATHDFSGVKIGSRNTESNYWWDGNISVVRIYKDKALTVAEVLQNYNAIRSRYSYPTSTTSTIVTSGLILHLDAANTNSYSGSGNTWTDLSGTSNNATRTNSTEVVYNSSGWFDWTDGPAYDSTQGCFTLPNDSFTLGANFTIEVWNYYDSSSAPADNPWVGGNLWTNSADADWNFGAGGNNGLLFGYTSLRYKNTSGSETGIVYSSNPTTQVWHQHVLVVNSGTATVYVDKVSVATASNFRTYTQSNGTLGIGIADKSGSNYRGEYLGFISNVKIYSQALSTSEIEFIPPW